MTRLCTLFLILTMLCSPFYAWAQSGTPDDPLIIDIVKGPADPVYADLNEPTLAPIGSGYRVAEGNAGDDGYSMFDPFTWYGTFYLYHMSTEQAIAYMLAHPFQFTWEKNRQNPKYDFLTKGRTWEEFIEHVLLQWTRFSMKNDFIFGADPEDAPPGDVPSPKITHPSGGTRVHFYVKSPKSCTWLINNNLDFHGRKRFASCREEQWYVPQAYTSGYRTVTRKHIFTRKIPRYMYWLNMYRDDPCDLVYAGSCWQLTYIN
jgi:hypothetical protein